MAGLASFAPFYLSIYRSLQPGERRDVLIEITPITPMIRPLNCQRSLGVHRTILYKTPLDGFLFEIIPKFATE
jgi:hypothetical protein